MGWDISSIFDLTNAKARAIAVVDANGDQITSFSTVATPPANATLSTVALSTTSSTLLAANTDRRRWLVHNTSGKTIFIAFAATASTTAYSVSLGNGAQYESPLGDYTGIITAVTQSSSGSVRVTEITV